MISLKYAAWIVALSAATFVGLQKYAPGVMNKG